MPALGAVQGGRRSLQEGLFSASKNTFRERGQPAVVVVVVYAPGRRARSLSPVVSERIT